MAIFLLVFFFIYIYNNTYRDGPGLQLWSAFWVGPGLGLCRALVRDIAPKCKVLLRIRFLQSFGQNNCITESLWVNALTYNSLEIMIFSIWRISVLISYFSLNSISPCCFTDPSRARIADVKRLRSWAKPRQNSINIFSIILILFISSITKHLLHHWLSSVLLWCAFPQWGLPDALLSSHVFSYIIGCGTLYRILKAITSFFFHSSFVDVQATHLLYIIIASSSLFYPHDLADISSGHK